ncbi:DUF6966 domain-containing protein [Parashewanella tropica]|uniref:DUF6966 domain-containing protein n=1 Tax=Parashewanella tropica TaxID=2547970 RepID=UPI001059F45F|nr:hypothetical protein [Parashewanella tropica]
MYEKTKADLRAIIALLDSENSAWSIHFKRALSALEAGEYYHSGRIILSGSGGMGSLNDLVLGQSVDQNGKFSWKPNHKELNSKYQELLDSLYGFARNIQRAANK